MKRTNRCLRKNQEIILIYSNYLQYLVVTTAMMMSQLESLIDSNIHINKHIEFTPRRVQLPSVLSNGT